MIPQTLRLRFTVNKMYNILYKKYLQQDMLLLLHMVVDRARDDFFVVKFRNGITQKYNIAINSSTFLSAD